MNRARKVIVVKPKLLIPNIFILYGTVHHCYLKTYINQQILN